MALGESYPAQFANPGSGEVRLRGTITYTNAAVQPQLLRTTGPIAISAAEILASFTTRKTILAAQTGKFILPVAHFGIYTAHGNAYDVSGAGNFVVGVTGDPAFPDISAGGFGNTNQVLIDDALQEVAGLAATADWFEQPILWGFDGANPTGGNGAWVWQMWYLLIDGP